MVATIILSGLVGLALGLLYCYWNSIKTIYQNRDLLSAGSNLVNDAQTFFGKL
jgi:hypothetical protein